MTQATINVTEGSGKAVDVFSTTGAKLRQAVVIGDPTVDANIAPVQSTDPVSNAAGIVVRDVNSSAVVAAINAITINTINRVNNVVDGTLSTVSRVSNVVDGTLSLLTRADRIMNLVDGTISTLGTLTRADRVMNLIDGTLTTVTGVDRVRNIVDGTISTVTGITNTVAVYFQGSSPAVSVEAKYGATKVPLLGNTDGAIKIYDIADGSIVVRSITGSVGVYFQGSNPAVTSYGMYGATKAPLLVNTDGAVKVYDIVTGTINTVANVTNITNTIGVNLGKIDGTMQIKAADGTFAVYYSPSNPKVSLGTDMINYGATAQIFTVSGSTSGVSVSGVTLISPSAAYSFKVFAFSLQTTGVVSQVMYFGNGSGASQTEFWRPLITASATTSSPIGANLAVSPPGYLFATGTSTTLVLVKDTASLVHYSVSYIKESA